MGWAEITKDLSYLVQEFTDIGQIEWAGITKDLSLNLVAEAVGIVATVFWIERKFKKREATRKKARWLPAANMVYARLYQALDDFVGLVMGYNYTKNHKFLIFGQASSSARVDLSSLRFAESYFTLEKEFKDKTEMKRLSEEYEYAAPDYTLFDRTPYVQLKDELFKNLSVAAESIEPEMRGQLLDLDFALTGVLSLFGEHITDTTHVHASRVIDKAVETMERLKSTATEEITDEEFFSLKIRAARAQ